MGPARVRDEHREELLAMIERKAEGKELVEAPAGEEREATKAPDLMAALEESIAAVQGKRAKPAKKRSAPATGKKRPASRAKASKARSR